MSLIANLPDDLPAETLERIGAAIREASRVVDPAAAVEGLAVAVEWSEGAVREEVAEEPDRWLEERR